MSARPVDLAAQYHQQDAAKARRYEGGCTWNLIVDQKSPVPAVRHTLFLARVAQGRILLDIEPPDIRRAEVVVGKVAADANTVHGAKIINFVNVARDPKCTHHLARLVADELAAAFQEKGPVR